METQILVEQSSQCFDIRSRRVWEVDSRGMLSWFDGYPAERIEPELVLHIGRTSCAYGLYRWGINCSHLLYDVLSDHFVNRLYNGGNEVIIPPGIPLATSILSHLGDVIRIGEEVPDCGAPSPSIGDEFCWVDNPWRFLGHQHSFITESIKANLSRFCSESSQTPRHIIIERRLMPGVERNRNVHHIENVRDQLNAAGYDFMLVDLHELAFLEQVNYFYNAEIIVATHGSGLTWLNFCRPQTRVIEISTPFFRKDNWVKPDFYILGHQNNLRYVRFFCEDVVGNVSDPYDHDANVTSDTLLRLLEL